MAFCWIYSFRASTFFLVSLFQGERPASQRCGGWGVEWQSTNPGDTSIRLITNVLPATPMRILCSHGPQAPREGCAWALGSSFKFLSSLQLIKRSTHRYL